MSFSSELKEELSEINNLVHKNESKFELLGYLISKNASIIRNNVRHKNANIKNANIESASNKNVNNEKNIVRYATESDYNINRFSKLLKNLDIDHNIEYDGKSFIITFDVKLLRFIYNDNILKINKNSLENDCNFKEFINCISENEKRSILRGTFLGAGSINNPENTYHLEINLSTKKNMEFVYEVLANIGVTSKKLETNKYCIYVKDGDEISTILALMGASKSLLNYENIRVQRDMNAKINRIVNCKTANLNKTLNASVEQVNAIKRLKETNKFNMLNDNLKEMAEIRLEYPDASLEELGKKLKNPVGKSGVNYRLKKIIQIANEELV